MRKIYLFFSPYGEKVHSYKEPDKELVFVPSQFKEWPEDIKINDTVVHYIAHRDEELRCFRSRFENYIKSNSLKLVKIHNYQHIEGTGPEYHWSISEGKDDVYAEKVLKRALYISDIVYHLTIIFSDHLLSIARTKGISLESELRQDESLTDHELEYSKKFNAVLGNASH
jgi:hypothetical protein